jgi:hypothetical protein
MGCQKEKMAIFAEGAVLIIGHASKSLNRARFIFQWPPSVWLV